MNKVRFNANNNKSSITDHSYNEEGEKKKEERMVLHRRR